MKIPLHLSPTEWLLIAVTGIALVIGTLCMVDMVFGPMALNDAGNKLASDLREIETMAKERNEFLDVLAKPASPLSPSKIAITDRDGQTIRSIELPSGISVAGSLKLDPQGIPKSFTTFTVRRGRQKVLVEIDERGLIHIPHPGL